MTGRWRVRPVDRPAGSQVPAKLTDEGSLVRRPAAAPSLPLDRSAVLNDTPVACQTREPTDPQGDRCPHIPAASAATYPLRCSAPQWARFDNRQKRPAYQPLPSLLSAAAAQEVQAVPRTDNDTCRTNSARSAPPNLHDPQRAKGPLDRRSKWFSLVTFFLQQKKVTRAGARNAPSRARRRNTCSLPPALSLT